MIYIYTYIYVQKLLFQNKPSIELKVWQHSSALEWWDCANAHRVLSQ